MRMAAEIAGIGSEHYYRLLDLIDDDEAFFEYLRAIDLPTFKSVESYNEKIRKNLEERISILKSLRFEYLQDIGRFTLTITNENIKHVLLSDQICYVLGYEVGAPIHSGDIARYSCDLRGGVSHLCVYINDGVIENMIVGDHMTSLLQIVAISGKPGDVIEKHYDSPVFNRVVSKEISDITIEIRNMDGRPIPFDYGVVIVTLVFKRALVF
jgi:hypothetical protein